MEFSGLHYYFIVNVLKYWASGLFCCLPCAAAIFNISLPYIHVNNNFQLFLKKIAVSLETAILLALQEIFFCDFWLF